MDIDPWLATAMLGVLAGMVVMIDVGFRAGRRRLQEHGERADTGLGVVEAAVFALFGLLLAFTFSAGASRFETRRTLAVDEANSIGTAWLRLDLLPAPNQPALRDQFRSYLDSRIEFMRRMTDGTATEAVLARTTKLQGEIWNGATAACNGEPRDPARTSLVLQAINQMIDLTTTRLYAARAHTPSLVFGLLFAIGLACSLMAGFSMAAAGKRSLLHIAGFTVVAMLTVYVILDLEYPRLGFIRLDLYDQALVDLRASMK